MTRRPSRVIVAVGFAAAFAVGVVLAQFDLSFEAVFGLGLLATCVLGAIALGLEFLRQSRPSGSTPHERRPQA
jgi:hypothetical protein